MSDRIISGAGATGRGGEVLPEVPQHAIQRIVIIGAGFSGFAQAIAGDHQLDACRTDSG